jgi:hypothetical protein
MKWYKMGEQDLPPNGTVVAIIRATKYGNEYLATCLTTVRNGRLQRDDADYGIITQYAIIETPELKQ